MESDHQPQIKGVVIISLPPPDNPSLGKTITAFTLTSDSFHSPTTTTQTQTQNQNPTHLPLTQQQQPQRNPRLRFPFPRLNFSVGAPRTLIFLLGISLFVLTLYIHVFPRVLEEFRRSNDDDDDNGPESFLFPLYPKMGFRGKNNVELKLGRFVEFDKENLVPQFGNIIKVNKLVSSSSSSEASVDSSTSFPVRGNVYPDGLYYTFIQVGNPPRRYFLDMDTGSDLTWMQCDAPCTSCAKGPNALYKPSSSNIVPHKDSLCTEIQKNQKNGYCETCHQCDYEIQYADSSSSLGVLVKDGLRLTMANGSLANINVVFGCAYDQQGLLLNSLVKTDGILGLSRAKVGLPSQLASEGIIKNVVGHCLTTKASGGGYMFLGDDFVPHWGMSWIPMLYTSSTEFYDSEIAKIVYGGIALNQVAHGRRLSPLVFDTGSSYTYFTKEAYSNLLDSLEEMSKSGLARDLSDQSLPVCWRSETPLRSVSEVKHLFKTITLQFGSRWWIISTKFQIPPEGYLTITNKGNVCLGIMDGSKVHDGSTTILGDISLRGHLVAYDNENQKIGWMNSDCTKPHRFTSLPFFE